MSSYSQNSQEPLDAVLSRWNDHQRSIETSFDITEMTFKLRLSGLRLLSNQSPETEKPAMDHGFTKHLIMYAKAATNAKRFQVMKQNPFLIFGHRPAVQKFWPSTQVLQ